MAHFCDFTYCTFNKNRCCGKDEAHENCLYRSALEATRLENAVTDSLTPEEVKQALDVGLLEYSLYFSGKEVMVNDKLGIITEAGLSFTIQVDEETIMVPASFVSIIEESTTIN